MLTNAPLHRREDRSSFPPSPLGLVRPRAGVGEGEGEGARRITEELRVHVDRTGGREAKKPDRNRKRCSTLMSGGSRSSQCRTNPGAVRSIEVPSRLTTAEHLLANVVVLRSSQSPF